MVFPGGPGVKRTAASAGDTRDLGLMPESRTLLGVGNGNPLRCSCMENSRDRGTWWAAVHRVAESQTQLSVHTHTHTHTHTPNFLSRLDKAVPDKVKNEKRKCVEQDISLSGHHSKGHIILSYYREKTQ